MSFLITIQVLFVLAVILALIGLGGIMIENESEERWMAPLIVGLIFAVFLGIAWGSMAHHAPCCKCPAEDTR